MANFLDLTTGLPALWAKIKSKFYTKAEVDALIPEDEVMWVNITSNSTDGYIADKTPTEIYNHVSNGGIAFAEYEGNTYTLGSFNSEESEFYFTSMQDGFEACYIIYIEESYVDISTCVIAPSNISPLMDGIASSGSSNNYSRSDHVHPSDTSRAAVVDVLTKTNTTSYTPTANYHPATKKYVDDSIGSITVPTASTTTPLMDGTAAIGSSTNYAKADHIHPSDTSKLTRHVSQNGGLEHSTISNLYNQFTVQVANDGGGLVNNFTLTPTSTTINNVVTPTSDGMAANKKYVDDAVAAAAPTCATADEIEEMCDTLGFVSVTIDTSDYQERSGKV